MVPTNYSSELNFQPRRAWPKLLPPLGYHGYLITGFDRCEALSGTEIILDLSLYQFQDVMSAAHPILGLAEAARFIDKLRASKLDPSLWDVKTIALSAQVHANDRSIKILKLLSSTPTEFQMWADEKALGLRDLEPLVTLCESQIPDSALHKLLKLLAQSTLTKSQGAEFLDVLADLRMKGRELDSLALTPPISESTLKLLRRQTRPLSEDRDEAQAEAMRRLPWPPRTKAQWHRSGDESFLELRMKARSPEDLQLTLEKLSKVSECWSDL